MRQERKHEVAMLALCAAAALTSIVAGPACGAAPKENQGGGASYPSKPIRMIVPFAPGGSTDTLGRSIGQKLSERFGEQVVVDNRAGGNGTIGTELIARAAPDGHTIGMAYIATLAINPALTSKMPYDPARDFAAVTQVTSSPNVLAIHPSLAANTVPELVSLAKAKPGQLNYASGGVGTIGHLSAELLQHVAGIKMQHIVYKGSGQAVIDLLGGHVSTMFSGMSSVLPHARAGRLRLLAVTGKERSPAAPEVPTVAESGYPGYEAVGWFGIIAPAGTPGNIVSRLNRETIASVTSPEVRERLTAVGFDIVTSTPAQFSSYIRSEAARWKKLVKDIGMETN